MILEESTVSNSGLIGVLKNLELLSLAFTKSDEAPSRFGRVDMDLSFLSKLESLKSLDLTGSNDIHANLELLNKLRDLHILKLNNTDVLDTRSFTKYRRI